MCNRHYAKIEGIRQFDIYAQSREAMQADLLALRAKLASSLREWPWCPDAYKPCDIEIDPLGVARWVCAWPRIERIKDL